MDSPPEATARTEVTLPAPADETFFVQSSLRRIDVTGDDRARYLEDVTTQHLLDAPVGAIRGTLHLDPHGAPLAMFDVVVLGDRLVLLAPHDVADWILQTLAARTFLLDAKFTPTEDRALSLRGAHGRQQLVELGLGFVEGRARVADDVLLVARTDGADLFGPSEVLAHIEQALLDAGVRQGEDADLERCRIAAGVPAWQREVRHPHLPEEAGVLASHVHLAKGCYPGQEAVARMWMLGRPRRRLVQLSAVAVAGDHGHDIAGQGAEGVGGEPAAVGSVEVTSVDVDGRLALGYAPADVPLGAQVRSDEPAGWWKVVARIGDESPPGHDPSVTRRRDRKAR